MMEQVDRDALDDETIELLERHAERDCRTAVIAEAIIEVAESDTGEFS